VDAHAGLAEELFARAEAADDLSIAAAGARPAERYTATIVDGSRAWNELSVYSVVHYTL